MSLPDGYPAHLEDKLTLKNGCGVLLRPILPGDGPLLVDMFSRCSPETRYLRFLSHIPALSEEMLYQFTHVDYVHTFALVALVEGTGSDSIVAVGRYSFDEEESAADLAITVCDDWQHLGLGKIMLARTIASGTANGITRFGSMMDPQNTAIKKLLNSLGYKVNYFFRDGAYQVRIEVQGR